MIFERGIFMLETKNLVKIYKPKKGVPVKALDNVSLKFADKGMVFLLGKSGSGKSTLLNLLGGLDNYNDGEIIIKGVSSKKFHQKHFDSYRNTYVGFIFQEYNVLDEFTVGANIALAIELQGRKATSDDINRILKQVDLEGYGARKPNELSGGQKQRVAIARALVKNPQIIMADEPTGALDSNTGKQVFDTLKNLSKEKLVIVVSHDREFAETYADRIIELADGKVISDLEIDAEFKENNERLSYNGNIIEVPKGYTLTEEDRVAINEYIRNIQNEQVSLAVNQKVSNKRFRNTDQEKIVNSDTVFKLIKSKLPLKNAFKIGASGLKHKKIRLVTTILLSFIAFGLFGLSDTFGAYNHIETCTNSLIDTNIKYIATAKSKRVDAGNYTYWENYGSKLSNADLQKIKADTGVEMHAVYLPFNNSDISYANHINPDIELNEQENNFHRDYFTGFSKINAEILNEMDFKILAGKLPNGAKNEIAISEYTFEVFKKGEYTNGISRLDKNGEIYFDYSSISDYNDIIGKTLELNSVKYVVTAVIDTNFNLERYAKLMTAEEHKSNADAVIDYVLYSEFNTALNYSYTGTVMTGDGFIERMVSEQPNGAFVSNGYLDFSNENLAISPQYLARFTDLAGEKIVWVDGVKQSLGNKEIIVTSDYLNDWYTNYEESPSEEMRKHYINDSLKELRKYNEFSLFSDSYFSTEAINESGYKIVGVIDIANSKMEGTVVCADKFYNEFTDGSDCVYEFCIGVSPKTKADLKKFVSYCYNEEDTTRFGIQNAVTFELDSINEMLTELSKWFLYIGIGFAIFASLMLANFISISISYKKQEIGILRAIGSRGNDVFRIFFAESFIIAMINFVLSSLGVFAATLLFNHLFRSEVGILVTVLSFSIRQVILLFAVSVFVAFVASYIPVKKIASKRPIDAIRDR